MSDRRSRPHRDRNGPPSREVVVSKKLSWLLRHGAQQEGLKIHAGGYVNVQDVLNTPKIRGVKVSFDEIRQIVRDNDKQRYAMVPASSIESSGPSAAAATDLTTSTSTDEVAEIIASDPAARPSSINQDAASTDPRDWLIRATQGHSIKLEDTDDLLTPVTLSNVPKVVVHGTTHSAWTKIAASGGLKPMGRNHVHFATALPAGFQSLSLPDTNGGSNGDADTEIRAERERVDEARASAPVVSGMRNTSTILIYIDVERAMSDGEIKFGISENGVVLTAGNVDGLVPIEFFRRVEARTGQGVLVEDGRVIKEAPASWAKPKGGHR